MKKLILSLAAVAALASCSQEEGNNVPEVVPGNVPIIVNAGLGTSVESKANGPIDGNTFAKNTENAFNLLAFTTAPTSDWSQNYFGQDLPVACDANGEFHTGRFYPAGGANLYFYAYAPGGSYTTNNSGVVSFTIDGQQDIMYAGQATGNASAQPQLSFSHKLMKVMFKAKLDEGIQDQEATLTNITINNVKTNYTLSLSDGTLTETGDAGNLSLAVSNQELTTSEATINGVLMLYPQTGFTITATAGGQTYTTPNPVTITSPAPGKEYTITLTFNGTEIIPTVTITDWVEGDSNIQVDVER